MPIKVPLVPKVSILIFIVAPLPLPVKEVIARGPTSLTATAVKALPLLIVPTFWPVTIICHSAPSVRGFKDGDTLVQGNLLSCILVLKEVKASLKKSFIP